MNKLAGLLVEVVILIVLLHYGLVLLSFIPNTLGSFAGVVLVTIFMLMMIVTAASAISTSIANKMTFFSLDSGLFSEDDDQ